MVDMFAMSMVHIFHHLVHFAHDPYILTLKYRVLIFGVGDPNYTCRAYGMHK